jgi:hypothetical protein
MRIVVGRWKFSVSGEIASLLALNAGLKTRVCFDICFSAC